MNVSGVGHRPSPSVWYLNRYDGIWSFLALAVFFSGNGGDFRGMKRVVWIGTSTYPFFLPSSDLRLPMSSGLGIVCLSFEILFRVFPENRSAVFTMSASCLNCLKSSSLECKRSWCLFCFFCWKDQCTRAIKCAFHLCATSRCGGKAGRGGWEGDKSKRLLIDDVRSCKSTLVALAPSFDYVRLR